MRVDGVILAGGRGSRLGGVQKALVEIDGRPIAARLVEALALVCADVMIVAGETGPLEHLGARVVPDLRPGMGPLAGLEAALAAAVGNGAADGGGAVGGTAGGGVSVVGAAGGGSAAESGGALLVVGCDLPFPSVPLLTLVRDSAPEARVVVPRVAGRPQALHARYARAILPAVRARLDRGALRLLDLVEALDPVFLDEPALRAVDPGLRGLTNVNTPEDLAAARRR